MLLQRERQPHDYLQRLSKAHRSLAIHGNYLEPSDWSFLAQNRQHMALVYCPRTHDYFGHERYPLTEMKQANVRIALGTDSRASNPNLNMLEELQFAARRHPDLAPQELLSMATSQAAAALGVADQVGTIESGKQADLAVVQLDEHASCAQDPYCQLLGKDTHVLATWVAGIEYPVR